MKRERAQTERKRETRHSSKCGDSVLLDPPTRAGAEATEKPVRMTGSLRSNGRISVDSWAVAIAGGAAETHKKRHLLRGFCSRPQPLLPW